MGAIDAHRLMMNSGDPVPLAARTALACAAADMTLLVLCSTRASPTKFAISRSTHDLPKDVASGAFVIDWGVRSYGAPGVTGCRPLAWVETSIADRIVRTRGPLRRECLATSWQPRCLGNDSVRPEALRPRLSASLPLARRRYSAAPGYKSRVRGAFRRHARQRHRYFGHQDQVMSHAARDVDACSRDVAD
jgi:hypothetical protein